MKYFVFFSFLVSLAGICDGPAPASAVGTRTKNLQFDSETLEGINGDPLDAVQNLEKRDPRSTARLYRKKTSLRPEMRDTVDEIGNTP